MSHRATGDFWRAYRALPREVRDLADKNFSLLRENPRHPSVRLKKVGQGWSARVGIDHRAIALQDAEGMTWFWIGPHDEYEKLIR